MARHKTAPSRITRIARSDMYVTPLDALQDRWPTSDDLVDSCSIWTVTAQFRAQRYDATKSIRDLLMPIDAPELTAASSSVRRSQFQNHFPTGFPAAELRPVFAMSDNLTAR